MKIVIYICAAIVVGWFTFRIVWYLIKRIRKSPDRENEGIRIAGETVAALKDLAQGVLIQTLGWEHRLPAILDVAGL